MSERNRSHLAPVPVKSRSDSDSPVGLIPTPPLPGPRAYSERLELNTGGRNDVDPLIRELCRVAFHGALIGFESCLDPRVGVRCFATVRVSERFPAGQVEAGLLAIKRALVALGVVQQRPAAAPEAAPQDSTPPTQDGAASPPPPSPPS